MYYVIHCRKPIYADLTVETIYLPEEKYLGWLGWRYNVFTLGKVLLLTWFRVRQRSPIWWPWSSPIWRGFIQVRLGPCLQDHHHQLQKMKPPSGDLDTPIQTAEATLPCHTGQNLRWWTFLFCQGRFQHIYLIEISTERWVYYRKTMVEL